MTDPKLKPLLSKIDCVRLYVSDLDAGLAFYCDRLGLSLLWRTHEAVALRLANTDAELVLQTKNRELEVDFSVESADAAAGRIADAGGKVRVPPFDIQIGQCVVVEDPWGNRLVLLDSSKGLVQTDADGRVIGNLRP